MKISENDKLLANLILQGFVKIMTQEDIIRVINSLDNLTISVEENSTDLVDITTGEVLASLEKEENEK